MTLQRDRSHSSAVSSKTPHMRSSYEVQQKASERRFMFVGVSAILAAGGLVLVASSLATGETTRSDQDIIGCAVKELGAAAANGIEVSALSDGAIAQYAAGCDPSSVDPLAPAHKQNYYLRFADELRP